MGNGSTGQATSSVAARLEGFIRGLDRIREEWIKSDRELSKVLRMGIPPQTGTFERIVKEEREPLQSLIQGMDRFSVDQVLPHVDPNLQDRILRVVALLDPEGNCGPEERWRQFWPETGLEAEFRPLIKRLSTAAAAHDKTPPEPDLQQVLARRLEAPVFEAELKKARVVQEALVGEGKWISGGRLEKMGIPRGSIRRHWEASRLQGVKKKDGNRVSFLKSFVEEFVAYHWTPNSK